MARPFKIKIMISKDGQTLEIKELKNEHNHELQKVAYEHLPRLRKLDTDTKTNVRNMLSLKASKTNESKTM